MSAKKTKDTKTEYGRPFGSVDRITDVLERLSSGDFVATPDLKLCFSQFRGRPVTFCTSKRKDPIQRANRNGRFYEMPELEMLEAVTPKGSTIVDIGANVGNHSLYFALFMGAKRVIPVEPNPLVFEMLIANVLVNGLSDVVVLNRLGVGVSDQHSGGYAMEQKATNYGAAQMLPGEGDIEVFRADELIPKEKPALIKIDVEGMELSVLGGLSGILKRCRPIIFIEVDNQNQDRFADWVEENDYESVFNLRRSRANINHLLVDKPRADAVRDIVKTLNIGTE